MSKRHKKRKGDPKGEYGRKFAGLSRAQRYSPHLNADVQCELCERRSTVLKSRLREGKKAGAVMRCLVCNGKLVPVQ